MQYSSLGWQAAHGEPKRAPGDQNPGLQDVPILDFLSVPTRIRDHDMTRSA